MVAKTTRGGYAPGIRRYYLRLEETFEEKKIPPPLTAGPDKESTRRVVQA